MISEHGFATNFTSLWHDIMPLADSYWRRENLKIKREFPPIRNRAPKELRGFLNELAFTVFERYKKEGLAFKRNTTNILANEEAYRTSEYIQRITGDKNSTTLKLDEPILDELSALVQNLIHHFPKTTGLEFRPKFSGCGVVSACEGDLIYDGCLYEIKAGDRSFRIGDIKQLLIYSSLAFSKQGLEFSKVGLFNPRNGYYWERTLGAVCMEVSGMRESDVLSKITSHMTSQSTSR